MQALGELNPAWLGAAGVALLVLFVSLRARARRRARSAPAGGSGRPTRVTRASHEAEAAKALRDGRLEEALDLYMRAQKPVRAAQVAQRLGRFDVAGELLEHEGELERAAECYAKAGYDHKAQQLRARAGPAPQAAPVAGAGSAQQQVVGPEQRARADEERFRAHLKAHGLDDDARALAERAADAWLSLGDIRRAADVCRDAGLVEQAVNYYVNVLGEPGEAAALVASQGDHARAAQLYEQAGQKQRALAAWVQWGTRAPDPLERLSDVASLGDEATGSWLEQVVQPRPLAPETLDLHYRAAVALQERELFASALCFFERVLSVAPGFRDVSQRAHTLRNLAPSAGDAAARSAQASVDAQAPTALEVQRPDNDAAPGPAPAALSDRDELQRLVNSAAALAVERAIGAERSMQVETLHVGATPPQTPDGTMLGAGPAQLNVQAQQVVQGRRASSRPSYNGPSIAELKSMLRDGQPPDLGNIEIYYRLGLASLAEGKLAEARQHFTAVEEVSPGYRDALRRAEEISELERSGGSVFQRSDMSAEAGRRYTLLEELGRGGMAVVYRAHDQALGRDVAMKFMAEDADHNPMFLSFFKREARAAGALNHPNIVTVYDVGVLDSRAFICMELVDGRSLESILEERVALSPREVVDIADQMLAGLEYAHERRIIHRDIKPANIMRTADGLIKLMDFGLAKTVEGPAKTTAVAGTPSYMPPEQLAGKGVDLRTDLFAAGATLYEMLTGQLPFEGFDRSTPPKPVHHLRRDVPVDLEALITRSLALDKEQRFPSASHMREAVRDVTAKLGTLPRAAAPQGAAGQAANVGGARRGGEP